MRRRRIERPKRRRKNGLQPSLMPFLAVLVCTLGTLILMLAIVASDARASVLSSEADASETLDSPQASLRSAEQLRDEANFRLREVLDHRQSQTADVERRRDELTPLEDHMQRLVEEAKRLQTVVNAANDTSVEIEDVRTARAEVERQIREAEQALEQKREQLEQAGRRFVIVPHDGHGGTTRRPIYLVCGPNGVRLEPEGITIALDDLARATEALNPIDALLRHSRLHYQRYRGDAEPPYPLLVVRPDGIDTYLMCRRLMKDWDDQFGYEMVGNDIDLAFPAEDRKLQREGQTLVERIVSQLRSMPDATTNVAGPQTRQSPAGFSAKPPGVISVSELSRHRQTRSPQQRFDSRDSFRPDMAMHGRVFQNHPDVGRQATAAMLAEPMSMDLSDEELSQIDQLADVHGSPSPMVGSAVGSGASDRFGASDPVQDMDPSGAGTGVDTRSTSGVQSSPSDSFMDADADEFTAGDLSATGMNESGDGADASAGAADRSLALSAESAESNPNANRGPGGNQSGPPCEECEDPNRSTETDPTSQQSPPSPGLTLDRSTEQWALPPALRGVRGSTAVRIITLDIGAAGIRISPPRRFAAPTVVPVDPARAEAALTLMTSHLRGRIESWGAPPAGGRWQPTIELRVEPEAAFTREQIVRWFDRSGIDVREASR